MKTSMEFMVMELERERILEFCSVIKMTLGNTFSEKKASHLVTYEPGPSKTQVDYSLVRKNQRKFFERYN